MAIHRDDRVDRATAVASTKRTEPDTERGTWLIGGDLDVLTLIRNAVVEAPWDGSALSLEDRDPQ